MDLNNIKRNQLDYILTDILPTELSERSGLRHLIPPFIQKTA